MSEPNETPWSAEQVYDEQIAPLMKQIVAICKEHQIPMVAKFQYAHDAENGPAFCTKAMGLVVAFYLLLLARLREVA